MNGFLVQRTASSVMVHIKRKEITSLKIIPVCFWCVRAKEFQFQRHIPQCLSWHGWHKQYYSWQYISYWSINVSLCHITTYKLIHRKIPSTQFNRVTGHPSYDPDTSDNDVIVFKLQRKVDYGILPDVYPACWPSRMPAQGEIVRNLIYYQALPYFSTILKNVLQATVSGFGATSQGGDTSDTLKEVKFEFYNRPWIQPHLFAVQVDVEIWSNSDCQFVQQVGLFFVTITDNMLCAGELFGGIDSCQVRVNNNRQAHDAFLY